MDRRDIRYQAAIVQDHHLLLLWYQPNDGKGFWLIPGGAREAETEEACVIREAWEETHLVVKVERLLVEEIAPIKNGMYSGYKTYLCSPLGGEASPGLEPEPEAAILGSITALQWFDLRDEKAWAEDLRDDPITYPQLVQLRSLVGYG